MRNKKLERVIALALVLGPCTCSVSEAYQDSIYGNSPTAPRDFTHQPTADGVEVSEYELNFNYNNINYAYGGYAINANALSNKLYFNSGDAHDIYAGYVYGIGNANNNELQINGGSIGQFIYGGFAGNGSANSNAVTINEGSFSAEVTGGFARNGSANDNIVNIKADMNNWTVVGGEAYDGNANNNTVNIMDAANNIDWVCGGTSHKTYNVNNIKEYTSNSNKVVINTSGNIKGIHAGYIIYNATAYKTLSRDNEVIVDEGNITNFAIASYTQIDSSKADNASYTKVLDNKVTINNGTVGSISVVSMTDDNDTGISSATSKIPMTISGNKLIINEGTVPIANVIYGENVIASALTVTDNSVDINGGTVGNVYGGAFLFDDLSTVVESRNNTVNWHDGVINGGIYGYGHSIPNSSGSGAYASRYKVINGSTFNFFASSSNSEKRIEEIGGFENYNFYLDNTVTANTTLIHLNGSAYLSNSNVGVAVLGSSPLQQGDSVTLLDATGSDGSIRTSSNLSNDTSHMTAENISTVYDFTLKNEDNKKLIATVSGAGSNPKAENLMGAHSAEAFMTYDKVDVVDKAYQASKHTSEPTSFIEYGYSDVTTKDDTKLRGSNVLWGIASTIGGEKDQANTLTRGLFFEYGDGTFSSIGHYPTGSIYGYGKSKKLGLGVLLRKVMFDRHYYDAYLRAGTIKTDYDAFADGLGNIKYENRDMYVSGNLGYGQFIQLTPNLQMDTYIKYFYNRIPGHSTTAYTNGVDAMPISFDVFENHRFRLGSKFTWDYMESNNYKWYADVALEQEFARDQSGSINSHRISKSNGSSTTGVIELCYENKFGANNAFMFTAKAQGYVGDRRGLGASANLSFSF